MKHHLALIGYHVRDVITGTEGVVTSIAFDISGCVQALVAPLMREENNGSLPSQIWFDTKRLKRWGEVPVMNQPDFTDVPGGPTRRSED